MKILLLEDDLVLSSEISKFLESHQMHCNKVYDGEEFLQKFEEENYDVFLLDINVPKINGLEVCKRIRERDKTIPIIIISAYDDISDKKQAFENLADDYLVKPFVLEELLLRINSHFRKNKSDKSLSEKMLIEDLEIFPDESKVMRGGKEISLTVKEFQLLLALAKANGRILSKQFLSGEVWQNHFETNTNTIEVYINFLRKKIDKDFEVKLIHTRPGFGYYLSVH